MNSLHYVYALLRENSVPFYIGIGQRRRWLDHEYRVMPGRSHKDNIICKMKAAGIAVPKIKLAENLSREQAVALEIHLIKTLGREPAGPLTNLTDGGEGAASEEARRRRSESIKKTTDTIEWRNMLRDRMKGKPKSAEHRAKIRLAFAGKKQSAELIEKRIAPLRGRKLPPRSIEHSAKCSHPCSSEARRKIADTMRVLWSDPTYRRNMLESRNKSAKSEAA
jgi:hypothetical protein